MTEKLEEINMTEKLVNSLPEDLVKQLTGLVGELGPTTTRNAILELVDDYVKTTK